MSALLSARPIFLCLSYLNDSHAADANAAHGDAKRRTRGLPTPHAEIANAARGDCHRRRRRFSSLCVMSFNSAKNLYKSRSWH